MIYRGKELSWQGRTLTGYNSGEYIYSYNSEGLRTSKAYLYYQSGEEKYYSYTNYTLDGDRVIRVDGGDDTYRYIAYYYYDANGRPFMMKYHPTASHSYSYYFYETNLQGDVVAIYDSNGAKVVSFTYDAWGNFTENVVNTTVCTNFFIEATLFRYRGYIYDYESGLYYLQSRYYDPETGRFINADEVSYLGVDGTPLSYNLYIYCGNNPIMGYDPTGHWDWKKFTDKLATIGIAVTSVAVGTVTGVVVATSTGGNVKLGIATGAATAIGTNAILNNVVNAAYYTFSDNQVTFNESDKEGSQYVKTGYLTRWDRLDYARQQTDGASYFGGGWAYYSEYSIHMYGWFAIDFAYEDEGHPLYKYAKRARYTDITEGGIFDNSMPVIIATILYGVFLGV